MKKTAYWTHCLIVSALAATARGQSSVGTRTVGATLESGWQAFPAGFLPIGSGRWRVLQAGRPIPIALDSSLSAGAAADFTFRLATIEVGGKRTSVLAGLLLSEPGSGVMTIEVEAAFPGFEVAEPVRFSPRGSSDVLFLGIRGSGSGVATGLLDSQGGVGLDLGGVHPGLVFSSSTGLTQPGRKLRIEGRIPRGKETVLFSCARIAFAAGSRSTSPSDLSAVGQLTGWSLPGGKDLLRDAVKLVPTLSRGAYLEIGDGWQGKSAVKGFAGVERSWPFAVGKGPEDHETVLQAQVSKLLQLGFKPALWIVPHGQGELGLFRERPEAFVRDKQCAQVHGGFLGRYVVDVTSRAGLEYLKELFQSLRAQGVTAFRLGGLGEALAFHARERKNYSDPGKDPLAALKESILAMRDGAGSASIFMGDWGTPLELGGLLASARPGRPEGLGRTDPLLEEAMASLSAYRLHRRAWFTECFPWTAWSEGRDDEEKQRLDRSRAVFAALTGRGIVLDAGARPPAWVDEVLRPAFPPAPVAPIDLFEPDGLPRAWDLKLPQGGDLVGLFNLDPLSAASVSVPLRDLGLHLDSGQRLLSFDVLAEQFVGIARARIDALLLPGECRLLSLHPDLEIPQVVAVSGHYLATATRLESVAWDADHLELRGMLLFPADQGGPRPTRVHIACGPGDGVLGATAERGEVQFSNFEGHLVLAVSPGGADRVGFRVQFSRGKPRANWVNLAPPTDLRVDFKPGERRPLLSWRMGKGLDGWRGVEGFAVWRDEMEIGRTSIGMFLDRDAPATGSCSYRVSTLPGGLKTASASFSVPPPRDAYLDDWSVATPAEEVKTLTRCRSATGGPLSVGGRKLLRGLGTRSPSRVDYKIDGLYLSFEALVGVDDASRFQGTVVFVVAVDGVERFRSPVLAGGSREPTPVSVPVRGGKTLTLITEDSGDGSEDDLADWGNARVVAE